MKVGSLVELVDDKWPDKTYKSMVVYPVRNKVYTVREFIIHKIEIGVLLEEIDNSGLVPMTSDNKEPNFGIGRFRELQPPIANIEEYINQNTLEPELI